jgi:pimeloyl-ACP methyl ester carboxylesterase
MKIAPVNGLKVVAIALVMGAALLVIWAGQSERKNTLDSSAEMKPQASSSVAAISTSRVSGSAPAPVGLTHSMSLPLVEGRLHLGKLLGQLGEWFELDGQTIEAKLNFQIDLDGKIGSEMLQKLQKITHGIVTFDIGNDSLTVTMDRLKLRRNAKRVRTHFRKLIETLFPEAAAEAQARYGIWVYTNKERVPIKPEAARFESYTVVLVHGLDDPGRIWLTLRPKLIEAGYTVAQFEYPNDQPLDDSAKLMVEELEKLKRLGVHRVTIVAHSMGGLISRHALTDPRWYAGRGKGHPAYPDVDRLVMTGTPQQGSELARLRLAAEVRDQIERTLSGNGLLFGGIFDGAGEAMIDLLPRSRFLTTLNARPKPSGVKMTIIAGRASPVTKQRLQETQEKLQEKFPGPFDEPLDKVISVMRTLIADVGDGAVSLASTKLEGVDDYIAVNGNHMTMLRNLIPSSKNTPPAVPLILERLAQAAKREVAPEPNP